MLIPAQTALAAEGRIYEGWAAENGALRVEGTQLVNKDGVPIQLRGMSTHGLRWYPEYTNYPAIMDTKARGANLFRLAMYADKNSDGGYSRSENDALVSKKLLYAGLENALAADMYVIVDWHLLKDENPLLIMDKAVEFFAEVTSRYPNHPAILYEICNEPNGGTTWEDIRAYAETVIPVIREKSPDAVILVGTPHWSSHVLSPALNPLPDANIMYSFHLYTGFNKFPDFRDLLGIARKLDLPVFVTEWGISALEETGELNVEMGVDFIAYMREHMLSWANWSLANKAEDFSAIKPESTKLSNWTDEDLTVSGKLIFNALRGGE